MSGTVRKNRIPASGDGDEGSLAGSRREWGWCGRKSPPTIPSRCLSTRYGIVCTRARQAYVDILKRERYHEHTHTAVCRGYTCRLGPTTAAGVQRAGCLCLAAARTLDGWGRICGSTLQRTCPPLLDAAQACRRLPACACLSPFANPARPPVRRCGVPYSTPRQDHAQLFQHSNRCVVRLSQTLSKEERKARHLELEVRRRNDWQTNSMAEQHVVRTAA